MQDDKGTVLDPTASFEGKLAGSNVTVQGRFKGTVQASGVLRILQGSDVDATIEAARVEIGGSFRGEVKADYLQVLEHGRASGSFRAKTLNVKEGANLNGELEIGDISREDASSKTARSSGPY